MKKVRGKDLMTLSVCKAGNKDEVLTSLQISGNASLDNLRQEIAGKLTTDPHVSLQLLLGETYLLGPGTLRDLGLRDGGTVGLLRKRGLVVTGSADKTCKVWCAKSGKTTFILSGHTDAVHSATFSPDNRIIATGSHDNCAKIWSLENGQCVATIRDHKGCVASTAFSSDGSLLLTGSWDKTAKIWRVPDTTTLCSPPEAASGGTKEKSLECVLSLEGHQDGVNSAVFAPSGQFAVTGSLDSTAKVWGTADGKCWGDFKGHTGGVRSVGFSPDGQLLVTGSQDMTAKVWNAVSCACKFTVEGHKGIVNSASFSPDGAFIVTASRDRNAKVWCARTGQCLNTLKGHTDTVFAARFSLNGKFVLTGSSDNSAKVWTLGSEEDGKCELSILGHADGIRSAAFSSAI